MRADRLRDTKYARELATARLPSGPSGTSFVAIERIFVKQADQVEIRFSSWEGSRMLPRPLDLPEDELLSLIEAAVRAEVFSESFTRGLRALVAGPDREAPASPSRELTDLDRVQAHFHALIHSRAGDQADGRSAGLPVLAAAVGTEDDPLGFPMGDLDWTFKYWWDPATPGLRLMSESWSRAVSGSGQLHEITPAGARLLGEGFI